MGWIARSMTDWRPPTAPGATCFMGHWSSPALPALPPEGAYYILTDFSGSCDAGRLEPAALRY